MNAERMPQDLAVLLDRHEASARDEGVWSGGTIRLRIASYLSDAFVPLAYVTSVRSVVLRGDAVLTMRNVHEWHVLPGGRCKPGETPEQTLRREIWEEAGVLVEMPAQLGFMHLHHLSPEPPGYAYPYPDFLWLVYVTEAATAPDPDRVADDYEQEALFRSIAEAEELELSIQSRLYLDAARRIRRGWSGRHRRPHETRHRDQARRRHLGGLLALSQTPPSDSSIPSWTSRFPKLTTSSTVYPTAL